MLVLTRKAQEEILIGDSIRISIVRIQGNAVRLGIEAPRDVRVVRAELPPHDETPGRNERAANVQVETVFVDGILAEEGAEGESDDKPAAADRTLTPAMRNPRVQNVLRAMLAGSRPA